MKKTNRADIVIPAVMIAISAYVFFTVRGMRTEASLFPMIVSVVTSILSAILLSNTLLKAQKQQNDAAPAQKSSKKLFWLTAALIVFYAFGIILIGFYPATLVYFIASFYVYRVRKLLMIACVTVGMAVCIYFVFTVLLSMRLPIGVFFGGELY